MLFRIEVIRSPLMLAAGLLIVASACRAGIAVPPDGDLRWKPIASAPGAYRLDVRGAPDREGAFVYLLRVPAGLAVPAHTHNGDLTAHVRTGHQIITVRRADGTNEVHELRPGQRYRIPAGSLHEERFPAASVIELSGTGPLRTERPATP